MRTGRLVGLAVAGVMVAVSAALVWARPPTDDASRLARVQALYKAARGAFDGVPEVEPDAVADLVARGAVLVDVRPPEERAVSMLPGAVPAEVVEADPAAFAGRPLVAYCTIGVRSGLWAKARRAEGLDARNLAGSVLAWTHAGLPLERDGAPTRDVHVYGPTWNLARTDHHPVW